MKINPYEPYVNVRDPSQETSFAAIQENAEKNGINLSIQPNLENSNSSKVDPSELQVKEINGNNPQNLVSKFVQWIKRIVFREQQEEENLFKDPSELESLAEIPLTPRKKLLKRI